MNLSTVNIMGKQPKSRTHGADHYYLGPTPAILNLQHDNPRSGIKPCRPTVNKAKSANHELGIFSI